MYVLKKRNLALHLAMFLLVEVTLRSLSGESRVCAVMPHEQLCAATPRIGDIFEKPNHRVRLVSNSTGQVHVLPQSQPFVTGDRSFTVVFHWVSRWMPGLGRLPALADRAADDDDWPQHSADQLHAGSAYSTPYTRQRWAPRLGMTLKEAVNVLVTERRHAGDHLPRGLVGAIRRVGRCSNITKLTVASARNLLYIAEQARLCGGLSTRLAGDMLDVYLRGVGLKSTRRRYTRKSPKRPEVPLHVRVRNLKALG